ncbi:TatD family hydrolase [Pedobacter frigoris]|uniref:TatD family deoxyribonuclease n=1 Tax=Pedobacter frigoris TaxID=2571272 RepID=A0A4U1CIF7_9SPHI|nr:TatD family hydrolase [Pedobacter frigoris]TKC05075.1 TatD family deoxyribonuclease [Pedobacter frigoris]
MQFFNIHTHHSGKSENVLSIQSFSLTDYSLVLPPYDPISVGLHPWYAGKERFDVDFERLGEAAQRPNVKMIGECGLDRLKGEPLPDQILMLEKHIGLAESIKKPLILHCVRAFPELMAVKDKMKVTVPMVIHGFNKHENLGRKLLEKGFVLSFGAAILKADSGASKLIQSTDNFFLETDDSEVTIEEIYETAANLKKCYVEDLKARIFADWKKLTYV